ncbi:MAG: 4-hydroxy-3-methylbut-2-enyl diphosphate reductase [Muribaculaceae bacterium]|nr:4-hydroxy-3-methylbut-2-enyl diphosphate reductase [Muribaculaceae bacterium]
MSNPVIKIDDRSGFCFGVVTAIHKAEEKLDTSGTLYCLGDIVHNSDEVQRLMNKGLKTITHDDLKQLHDVKVLLRAHGEPPSTYQVAKENNIEIIDATCPVVLQLQKRIKSSSETCLDAQIVIYGKQGHAEVNGLVGQTDGRAIVVQDMADLDKIDFTKDIELYSQTTMSLNGLSDIINEIKRRVAPGVKFNSYDTICRQVANRVEHLREFAAENSVILFVSGKKSSNGRFLFDECKSVNPSTYMISNQSEIKPEWLIDKPTIGICGATSTPRWLMEDVYEHVKSLTENG